MLARWLAGRKSYILGLRPPQCKGSLSIAIVVTPTTMRTSLRSTLPFVLLLTLAAAAGAQTLYKSIGPDGRTVYTDRPPAQGTLQKTLKVEDLPNTSLPPSTLAELAKLRAVKPAPAALPSGIVLFAASWCGYCRQARSHLAQKGVSYREVDIDSPDGKFAFVQAGGGGGVPLLVANGQTVRGFSGQAYDNLFAKR